ncbi:MAG: alanine--glyoxylate aminotransferase family protein [Planctomycetota bacterium]|nr:alanine--glyoxylate aminotransferase family protein [Planctomycetota bacterium]
MALKEILLTPGPSQVPHRVRAKLAEPAWYHRSSRFREIYKEVRAGLQQVFETQSDVLVFTGSGTVAMEAGIVNIVGPGRKAVVVSAGKWGERLVQIFEQFKLGIDVVKLEYGRSPSPEQLAERAKDPAVQAVYVHLCETSTGAKYDIEAIGKAVRAANPEALLAVDGISGAIGMACPLDAWGVDLFMAGSQKGLMMPPGLSMLTVSPKAWKVVEGNKGAPTYYSSLLRARKDLPNNDTPFTPGNTLFDAQNEALKMLLEEGIHNVHKRHATLAQAARAGVAALGLELFPDSPAEVLTVVKAPNGIESSAIIKYARDRFGVTLADGQGDMKGKVLRLAHMGYCSGMDLLSGLAAIEFGLKNAGAKVTFGSGVAAAQELLAKAPKDVWM